MANNSCLDKAISDYLLWLIDTGYAESTIYHYERMLIHFQNYIGSDADSLDVILSNTSGKTLRFAHLVVRNTRDMYGRPSSLQPFL